MPEGFSNGAVTDEEEVTASGYEDPDNEEEELQYNWTALIFWPTIEIESMFLYNKV